MLAIGVRLILPEKWPQMETERKTAIWVCLFLGDLPLKPTIWDPQRKDCTHFAPNPNLTPFDSPRGQHLGLPPRSGKDDGAGGTRQRASEKVSDWFQGRLTCFTCPQRVDRMSPFGFPDLPL